MNPEELRIGSIVWLKSKKMAFTITSGDDIDKGIDSDDFKPIELTKSWLRQLGFENFEYNNELKFFYAGFEFTANFSSIKKSKFLHLDLNNSNTSIKYLHQFQNLILALTGTELKL